MDIANFTTQGGNLGTTDRAIGVFNRNIRGGYRIEYPNRQARDLRRQSANDQKATARFDSRRSSARILEPRRKESAEPVPKFGYRGLNPALLSYQPSNVMNAGQSRKDRPALIEIWLTDE